MKKFVFSLVFLLSFTVLFAQEQYTIAVTPSRIYKIGDIGSGGGIIFYTENSRYMEYSEELGKYRWNEAVAAAKDYRGGGLSDWYLPTRSDLDILYRSTRENKLGGIAYDWYWTSSEVTQNSAWYKNFRGGRQGSAAKVSAFRVIAVRSEEIHKN